MKFISCYIGIFLAVLVGDSFVPVVIAMDADDDYVTCGSAIKLTSQANGGTHFLSSGTHKINSGSNQQLVTASPKRSESDLLWIINAAHGAPDCEPGSKIQFGSKFRLTHMNTGSNLHSHLYKSPLTRNQEVTGFGDEGIGDAGDNWKVKALSGSGNYWKRGQTVFIEHVDTGKLLGTSPGAMFTRRNCGNRCPVMDHQEVSGMQGGAVGNQWKADLGVYLSL